MAVKWIRIMGLVAALSRVGAAVMAWLNRPARQRAAAEADVRRLRGDAVERAEADAAAVQAGDKERVNRRLSELLPVVMLMAVVAGGCARIVYVPADREVTPLTHEGRAGWFVPNATLIELLRAAQRARDLEWERAVEARMEGRNE